ncbi:MAG: SURF1 family protein [Trueperaceae bacterium]
MNERFSGKQAPPRTNAVSARTLLTRKWLLGHLLALLLIVLFVNFGMWQLRRLDQRQSSNTLIAQRAAARPQPLGELLESHAQEPEVLAYRRAYAQGSFEPEFELLLRSRSHQGVAGWHVLTPLVQESGRALLVDRGWVPYEMDTLPLEEASPPAGEVRVEGVVRLEQDPPKGWAANFAPRDPGEGSLASSYYVDVDRLSGQIPFPLEPVYLEQVAQDPAQTGELPLPPEREELNSGSHLSYALQWFSFAVIGLIGYAILLWRTARGE